MNFYNNKLHYILEKLNTISHPKDKKKYLLEQKRDFNTEGNTGTDADIVRQWFQDSIEDVEFDLELLQDTPRPNQNSAQIKKPKTNKKQSYQWLGNPESELPQLFQCLSEKELITEDVTPKQISDVFTSKEIDSIAPIKWASGNASELLYFIYELMDKGIIIKSQRMDYVKLRSCFVKANGSRFPDGFKDLKGKLKVNLSEQKQTTIDNIVNEFF